MEILPQPTIRISGQEEKSSYHRNFQNAIAIARSFLKPDLFTFTCNSQSPEITHSLLPNQQPQERPDGKFHLLSRQCDTLAEPLLFLNIIDIETLHLHQHHLLLVLLIPKTPNVYTVCEYNMACLHKYPKNVTRGQMRASDYCETRVTLLYRKNCLLFLYI